MLLMQHWPVREVLLAYLAKVRDNMKQTHQFNSLLWQIRATFSTKPGDPPQVPELLKGNES